MKTQIKSILLPIVLIVTVFSACNYREENSQISEHNDESIIPSVIRKNNESLEESDKAISYNQPQLEEDVKMNNSQSQKKDFSKYREMDIKQFLIDNYNFLEEDIDPNYDLVAFMRDYRFDERNYSEELVKAAYEENKYYYLPTEKGYISWFLSDNESTPITQEDKFIKVGYSWGEDLSINENVLYDLEKDLVYSDGKEPSELSESKLEVVSGIVKQYCIDKWELCQVYEGDSEACDGWSGWKMVFELEDGSKRAYSGSCGPGEEIPSEWKSLRNILLN